MKHLSEGRIRAYIDLELETEEKIGVQQHLESCEICQQKMMDIQSRMKMANANLTYLDIGIEQEHLSLQAAKTKLNLHFSQEKREDRIMKKKLISVPRLAWIAIVVVLLLIFSLSFAPVRAVANTFLGLFRVEQIRVVEVNPDGISERLEASSQFEYMMSNNVQVNEQSEPFEVADVLEASEMVGIPVRLPTVVEGEEVIEVQLGGNVTFNVDLDQIRIVLNDIGRSDIEIPKELDGSAVTVDIPSGVVASYGECDMDEGDNRDEDRSRVSPETGQFSQCTRIIQMPSPTISAPTGLDISQIGEAFLQVMGLEPEEAEILAKNVDWSSTLVIPIPRGKTTYQEVSVDNVNGTLIKHKIDRDTNEWLLIWLKDGILYAIIGPGDGQRMLDIAGSME